MDLLSWGSQYPLEYGYVSQKIRDKWDDLYVELTSHITNEADSSRYLHRPLKESFTLPFTLAALFLSVQIIHFFVNVIKKTTKYFFGVRDSRSQTDQAQQLEHPIYPGTFKYLSSGNRDRNVLIIFGYAVARLLGCLSLFAMSMKTLTGCSRSQQPGLELRLSGIFEECPEAFMTLTYVRPHCF